MTTPSTKIAESMLEAMAGNGGKLPVPDDPECTCGEEGKCEVCLDRAIARADLLLDICKEREIGA